MAVKSSHPTKKAICINNNYKFNSQKTYDDLRGVNNGKLSYDFYLNDYNTCIEYNGEQHYRPVNIFGGEKRFKKGLTRGGRCDIMTKLSERRRSLIEN